MVVSVRLAWMRVLSGLLMLVGIFGLLVTIGVYTPDPLLPVTFVEIGVLGLFLLFLSIILAHSY